MPVQTQIGAIQKASSPEGFRDQLLNLVNDRKMHSERFFTGIRKELPQLYDLYRGVFTGRFTPHKNSVHIPLIFSTIQSDVARKTQTSFGAWPVVSFLGYSDEDAIIARKREALVSAQMKDAGSFKKGYELFLTADLYGTSVIQYGWNHKKQNMMISQAHALPVSGQTVMVNQKKSVVTFDGPDWKVLDLLDCFPQPGFRDIKDMAYFITREYLDLDDIRALAEPDEDGQTIFDAAEVARMEREGFAARVVMDDYKTWRSQGRTLDEAQARNQEPLGRPVEVLTMWGTIPSELASDGCLDRVITVANGRYLFRNRPLPFWTGEKPLLSYSPMPDPHYFFAAGKAEITKKLQIVANRFTNQQLDALDIFIDPAFFYNSNLNLNTRNLLMRPGKFIPVQGNPAEGIQAIVPNLNGVQLGGEMTNVVWQWMQQGTGIIEDTVMGGGGNRQTAREFLGRSEAVATRLLMESRLFEEYLLEPLADKFVDLNRQFLSLPHEVFILGEASRTDTITGLPIPETTRQSMDGWDLVPNYDAKAVGATTRLGRANQQQNLTFLLQAASQNPIAASAVNWINFFREIFKAFEIPNINEVINNQAQMQQMLQQTGAAGGDANQVPNVAGTPQGINQLGNFLNQGNQ